MRGTMLAIAVASCLGTVAVMSVRTDETTLQAQVHQPASSADGLLAMNATTPTGDQLITVIDRQQQVMSVYLVESKTGEINLKSVRNLRWDFMMDEFNGTKPLPEEIRALVHPR